MRPRSRPCAFAELGPSSAKLISPRSNAASKRADFRPCCLPQMGNSFWRYGEAWVMDSAWERRTTARKHKGCQ
jgi:hypothetical protein